MNKAGRIAYCQILMSKQERNFLRHSSKQEANISKRQGMYSLLAILLLFCSTLNAIRVTLSATDFQDHPITEVDADQLFLWNVTITDVQESAELLRITNTKRFSLDNFAVATTFNRQGMSISYRCRASAEAPGDYRKYQGRGALSIRAAQQQCSCIAGKAGKCKAHERYITRTGRHHIAC